MSEQSDFVEIDCEERTQWCVDRRACTQLMPPPFDTRVGVVAVERRSPLDRRAQWIRQYSLEMTNIVN